MCRSNNLERGFEELKRESDVLARGIDELKLKSLEATADLLNSGV